MKRPFFLLAFLMWMPVSLLAQTNQSRQHLLFDNDWRFSLGHAADPAKDFNFSLETIYSKSGNAANTAANPRFDDKAWQAVTLPHDWLVKLPNTYSPSFDVMAHGYKPVGGYFPENSIGWYRKHFNVAKTDSGQRVSIQFDGVFRNCQVWLNGFYIGRNESGYSGFSFDITDLVEFGKDNVIVLRVDASQYEGWFYEGAGIYRHAWLNIYSPAHLSPDGLFLYSTFTGDKATLHAETELTNEARKNTTLQIQTRLTDRSGKLIGATAWQSVSLNAGETKKILQQIPAGVSHRWSLEDPYLYRVTTVIKQNGKISDSLQQRFGFRTVEIKTNGVFLNGQHVVIKGVCNHQDHAGLGSALPDYMQYYRIGLLKEMGTNAYRTSHNPPTPELLDACDSLGMLVLDENRLLNSSPEYLSQFERLLRRDRNHASVFMWSLGNEEGWVHGQPVGQRIALTLLNLQHQLDPTRVSTYGGDNGGEFKGVNEVMPVRGFNYRIYQVKDYHNAHPLQPVIGSEVGSTVSTRGVYAKDTIKNYLPDQDSTAPPWASTAEAWWKLAAVNDYWLGGFVWTGFDYRGEPTPFEWPNINSHFGLMDMCGFPKNIYYYYQSWWTDKDVLHISPHWNFNGHEGEPIKVWVNTNADDAELFLNGKSLGKQTMPRNGHLNWVVPYAPGVLEAIAYKKGKKLTTKVETTGAAAEVVVTPYKTTMLADGRDVAVINISVQDKQGREVPDADNLIRFTLTGDAKIIGVGNGDPSSHEPDQCEPRQWQRKLFNGKCQVIIQAGTNPDKIHFVAKAEGCWEGNTDLHTVPVALAEGTQLFSAPVVFKTVKKNISKMIGADISFLPELEDKGMHFSDGSGKTDAIEILKAHGFNYVRLRIFNDPAADSGYSPKKGFCDLAHTKAMAKRVKAAGMKLLLDFHYSDTWADPGKQFIPGAWKGMSLEQMKKALYDFTKQVMTELKAQGTTPDMVQIGNEINHGICWPVGHISDADGLAELLKAGTSAVLDVDPSVVMVMHIALGGQNDESVDFINKMLARGVYFDVIGESWYPKWHGTPDNLRDNLDDLVRRFHKPVMVAEYSQQKEEANRIAFSVRDDMGVGTCIWEPLSTWERFFERDGKANELLGLYDKFKVLYLDK